MHCRDQKIALNVRKALAPFILGNEAEEPKCGAAAVLRKWILRGHDDLIHKHVEMV